jgi:prolyl-tRNA synthetase
MRLSRLFGETLRESPSDAEMISHQLLLRAGFIRPLAAGIFSCLPLARRAFDRIETILREEIHAIGGQEISMPVVHPAEVWQVTGRWYQIGSEMGRFKDKNEHDMVLAMTYEEVVADLVRHEIRSYRQLPALLYQIQTRWRDDPRPRAGLIRAREFTMLDSYSLDASWEGLDAQYQAHYNAYFRIFERCGLPVHAVKSDTGLTPALAAGASVGGKMAHEYMYLTPVGEDTLLFCPACDYSANRQVARFSRPAAKDEAARPMQKVATPHTRTIEELARFLNVAPSQTAKAVFLVAALGQDARRKAQFVFAVVRGDLEVNEAKLGNVLAEESGWSVLDLRPALEEEIRAVGAEPGYASPVGLESGAAWVWWWTKASQSRPTWLPGRMRRAITSSMSITDEITAQPVWRISPLRRMGWPVRSAARRWQPAAGWQWAISSSLARAAARPPAAISETRADKPIP